MARHRRARRERAVAPEPRPERGPVRTPVGRGIWLLELSGASPPPSVRCACTAARGAVWLMLAVAGTVGYVAARSSVSDRALSRLPAPPRAWLDAYEAAAIDNPARVCSRLFAPGLWRVSTLARRTAAVLGTSSEWAHRRSRCTCCTRWPDGGAGASPNAQSRELGGCTQPRRWRLASG